MATVTATLYKLYKFVDSALWLRAAITRVRNTDTAGHYGLAERLWFVKGLMLALALGKG